MNKIMLTIALNFSLFSTCYAQVTDAQSFTNDYLTFKEELTHKTSSFISDLFNHQDSDDNNYAYIKRNNNIILVSDKKN